MRFSKWLYIWQACIKINKMVLLITFEWILEWPSNRSNTAMFEHAPMRTENHYQIHNNASYQLGHLSSPNTQFFHIIHFHFNLRTTRIWTSVANTCVSVSHHFPKFVLFPLPKPLKIILKKYKNYMHIFI